MKVFYLLKKDRRNCKNKNSWALRVDSPSIHFDFSNFEEMIVFKQNVKGLSASNPKKGIK